VEGNYACSTGENPGLTHGAGRDVGEIGGNARGVDDIVKSELVDVRGCLKKKRKRLYINLC
jgi:hypothetical protein